MKVKSKSTILWIGILIGVIGISLLLLTFTPTVADPSTVKDPTASEGYAIANAVTPYYRTAAAIFLLISAGLVVTWARQQRRLHSA
jgi:hypothetical protein